MIFILGGAYQGKLDFVKKEYGIIEEDVFSCNGSEIDFSRRCIYGLERFSLACIREGKDPIAYLKDNREQWEGSVLICRDIFCGVVPLEKENRVWRQVTGRLCQYCSKEAAQVSRIFCGLEQQLK